MMIVRVTLKLEKSSLCQGRDRDRHRKSYGYINPASERRHVTLKLEKLLACHLRSTVTKIVTKVRVGVTVTTLNLKASVTVSSKSRAPSRWCNPGVTESHGHQPRRLVISIYQTFWRFLRRCLENSGLEPAGAGLSSNHSSELAFGAAATVTAASEDPQVGLIT
jgi:hypothetical protein